MRRQGFGIVALVAAVLLLHGGAVSGQDKVKTKKHKAKSSDSTSSCIGACSSGSGGVPDAAAVGPIAGAAGGAAIGAVTGAVVGSAAEEKKSHEHKLADDLIKILDETQSTETFFVTLQCLVHTKAEPDVAVPAIIRNADRLRLTKGMFDHTEKTVEQDMLAKALKHFVLASNGEVKKVKKVKCPAPPAPPCCTPCQPCQPLLQTGCSSGSTLTLPSGHYLEHPPQYVPESGPFPLPSEQCQPPAGGSAKSGPH